MKRLPALMLSVFLLTLLSLPATAITKQENLTDKEKNLLVSLAVNTSDMVDVTITWNELNYTYGSNGFAADDTDIEMPKITVTNNNLQNSLTVNALFKPTDASLTEDMFDLYFYEDLSVMPPNGENVKDLLLAEKSSISFYALPYGNPAHWSAASAKLTPIGNVCISIALNNG